jgi:hypothetical protein
LINSKLLQILHWNFENSKNQYCTSWKDLQSCFLDHPQIHFRFWITQKGIKVTLLEIGVLNSNSNLIWFLH